MTEATSTSSSSTSPSDWVMIGYRLHIGNFSCTHCMTSWKTSSLYEEYLHRATPSRKRYAPVLSVGVAPLWDLPITIANDERKLVPACHCCVEKKGAFTRNVLSYTRGDKAEFANTIARRAAEAIAGRPLGPHIASTRKDPVLKKETSIDELF